MKKEETTFYLTDMEEDKFYWQWYKSKSDQIYAMKGKKRELMEKRFYSSLPAAKMLYSLLHFSHTGGFRRVEDEKREKFDNECERIERKARDLIIWNAIQESEAAEEVVEDFLKYACEHADKTEMMHDFHYNGWYYRGTEAVAYSYKLNDLDNTMAHLKRVAANADGESV